MATFGVNLSPGPATTEPSVLRDVAQSVESLGFDSIWIGDHVVMPRNIRSRYPLTVDGVPLFTADHPMAEVLSTLTFLAGCTQRVRLGPTSRSCQNQWRNHWGPFQRCHSARRS
jgi:alkanesulfonate monooxygenase SsuD/methylene tetrahydromethanopterin reductase-like flavin-dependent oxidoreductase (luciferase family)